MLPEGCIPEVTTRFHCLDEDLYLSGIKTVLRRILPATIFVGSGVEEQVEYFREMLPLMHYQLPKKFDETVSFCVLYKHRVDAFKFFIEMMSRWLVPGKKLNVVNMYAADFCVPELSEQTFSICEVSIYIESREELLEIRRNLPIIETEVKLGIESSYYARRILEVKGQSLDEKTSQVQEHIAYLIRRWPNYFDIDLLTEMQHVLVMSRDDFKTARESRHLSRIISTHYLHRKELQESIRLAPEKRHLFLKLTRTRLHGEGGEQKNVLGIILGLNFLKDKELFEQKHILAALQNYIPSVQAIEGSFFANRKTDQICTLYLEVEKEDGTEFTREEIETLKEALPIDLKDRIEQLMLPIFMPRNEEEVMHNVLSLGSQLRYIRDIPQVTINFDEQTHANLFFTVILVRVTKPNALSIQKLIASSNTHLTYIHDRVKNLGYLRNKYLKEATVFRVKIHKEDFLRKDNSIDLYKARQTIFDELTRLLGELRDFNGGMISKQNELLCILRDSMGEEIKYNDLLLENFFYSLTPVIMRTLLKPETLKTLFTMHVDLIEDGFFTGENHSLRLKCESDFVYALVKAQDRMIKEELGKIFTKLNISSSDLANSYVKVYDTLYFGYIYRCDDKQKQRQFCQILHNTVESWENKKQRFLLEV